MESLNNYVLFYNKQLKTNETLQSLINRGIPADLEFIKSIGIYPINLNKPDYDKHTQNLVPSGFTIDDTNKVCNQEFTIVENSETDQLNELESVANLKRTAAQNSADSAAEKFIKQFSSLERLTWFKQQQEIADYQKDPENALTPTMDKIAEIRGIDRVTLINKAIDKLNTFNQYGLKIIGQQQKYEDQIKSIQNNTEKTISDRIKELNALTFDYQSALEEVNNN